jgi:hypothetical protein
MTPGLQVLISYFALFAFLIGLAFWLNHRANVLRAQREGRAGGTDSASSRGHEQ